MQLKLINHVKTIILYHIEVRVIAVARHEIAVFTIPFCMLHTNVLGRNHLTVEHHVLRTILFVILFNKAEHLLNEVQIIVVRINLIAHKFGSLYQAVDADGEILARNIDIACIKQWQHAVLLKIFQVLIVSHLHLMTEVYHMT